LGGPDDLTIGVGERKIMKSRILKRSVSAGGHKTSASLETEFWRALKEIAIGRQATLSVLIAEIAAARVHKNLSSALRVFVIEHYRAEALRRRADAAGVPSHAIAHEVREHEVGVAQERT
jgi:predicted DNA-binding ribbon-helix-helix protein